MNRTETLNEMNRIIKSTPNDAEMLLMSIAIGISYLVSNSKSKAKGSRK